MNFIQDWREFLRADLCRIGIELPALPDDLLPAYYLAILHKIKSAAEAGVTLTPEQMRTLQDVQALMEAEKLAQICQAEIAANQSYIQEHQQEIRKLLLKQCPELEEEEHRVYLSWTTWEECELVFEFVKSKIGLRERLKLRLE